MVFYILLIILWISALKEKLDGKNKNKETSLISLYGKISDVNLVKYEVVVIFDFAVRQIGAQGDIIGKYTDLFWNEFSPMVYGNPWLKSVTQMETMEKTESDDITNKKFNAAFKHDFMMSELEQPLSKIWTTAH